MALARATCRNSTGPAHAIPPHFCPSAPRLISTHNWAAQSLRQRNIDLAAEAASLVARRLNTETIDSDCAGAMRLVRLPVGRRRRLAAPLRARLLAAGTDAPVHAIGGALWLRLSAFAYNELEDYARLADIVARVFAGVSGMSVEFIGMIHHRQASEIHPPPPIVLDRGYIREFAQAAEAGGFDRVLVGYFADGPDGFLVAAAAAAHTERLGFLVAHRPGYVAPTLAARKFATLDQITDGRAAMHVITGGDDADQFRDGDTLTKEERYERTDEYVGILKRIWTEPGPTVDHEGKFYRFKGASTAMRCVQEPRIPIYFGGASDAALRVSAKHADVYALWGETHAQVREITARLRAEAARLGRTLRFSLSFRPILAPTEDEAWARAERIKQRILGIARQSRAGDQRAAERRVAPPAGGRRDGRTSRQTAMDRRGAGDRRARQHHQPGRHPGTGRRGAVRLLRPRRHHVSDPRLRSAGGQHRIRPASVAADQEADRRTRRLTRRGGVNTRLSRLVRRSDPRRDHAGPMRGRAPMASRDLPRPQW